MSSLAFFKRLFSSLHRNFNSMKSRVQSMASGLKIDMRHGLQQVKLIQRACALTRACASFVDDKYVQHHKFTMSQSVPPSLVDFTSGEAWEHELHITLLHLHVASPEQCVGIAILN